MSGYKRANDGKGRLGPFVALLKDTLDAPAWRAMSHGARSLYVALKRHYNSNNHNNGHIFLSQRDAARALSSHHNEIARWFRELQHYGFIRMASPGYLGVEGKGKAPRWRLTELGYMRDPPTREFARWDGTKFRDQPIRRKTKPRAGNGARGVREMAHTNVQENRTQNGTSVQENQHICRDKGVPENQHRTSLPLPPDYDTFPELPEFLDRRSQARADKET